MTLTLCTPEAKEIKLCHLNTQSLVSNFDTLKLHIINENLDLFTFSESWFNHNIPDNMFSICGYRLYRLYRLDRAWTDINGQTYKRGGGVGLYVKNSYIVNDSISTLNISETHVECIWIQVMLPNRRNLIVGSLNRPPDGSMDDFIRYLTDTIDIIKKNYHGEIYLLGDFNINYLDQNDNSTKRLKEFEQSTGLSQLIKDPTRQQNVLDMIFTDSNDVKYSGTADLNVSDHQLVYLIIKKSKERYIIADFEGRSYGAYDKDILRENLLAVNWNAFYTLRNPDEAWSFMKHEIVNAVNMMCPIVKRRPRCKNDPWISKEIVELINDKNKAMKRAKKNKSEDDWMLAKRLRNHVKDAVRKAKKKIFLKIWAKNQRNFGKRLI